MRLGYLCVLCEQPLQLKQHGICSICLEHLPPLPCCCYRCGLAAESKKILCKSCQIYPPYWINLIAVSDYLDPLKTLIHRFKFFGEYHLSKTLARLILLHWLTYRRHTILAKPDLLIPVPLCRQRYWQRGFNQAQLIAHHLAHWIGCDYSPYLLSRKIGLFDQKQLSAQQRKSNLTNSFICQQSVVGKNIALVDDIVTTGSTANEISKLLLQQGAQSIQLLCLCRTL